MAAGILAAILCSLLFLMAVNGEDVLVQRSGTEMTAFIASTRYCVAASGVPYSVCR